MDGLNKNILLESISEKKWRRCTAEGRGNRSGKDNRSTQKRREETLCMNLSPLQSKTTISMPQLS